MRRDDGADAGLVEQAGREGTFVSPTSYRSRCRREHFAEVMPAGKALQDTFQPWKLNYCCYGNGEPHVHWHIFPRYEDDPLRGDPWRLAPRFSERLLDDEEARAVAARIRENFV